MTSVSHEDNHVVRKMVRNKMLSLINNDKNDSGDSGLFFLTQFNENEGVKDDPKCRQVAIIDARSNSNLRMHGTEMKLQRNILAKYKVDVDFVTKNLVQKRKEFEKRISFCREKQNQVMIRQEESQQLVKKYAQFISEKEAIRKRAITKYQTELKIRLQKMLEYDILSKDLHDTRIKHQQFSNSVNKNKKFKDFLQKAIQLLPDNYLEAGESKFNSLISRHQTLYESNLDLFENLIANSDKLKVLRTEYEKIVVDHNSNKMTVNSKLGELQQIKEQLNLKNTRLEENLFKDEDQKRDKVN